MDLTVRVSFPFPSFLLCKQGQWHYWEQEGMFLKSPHHKGIISRSSWFNSACLLPIPYLVLQYSTVVKQTHGTCTLQTPYISKVSDLPLKSVFPVIFFLPFFSITTFATFSIAFRPTNPHFLLSIPNKKKNNHNKTKQNSWHRIGWEQILCVYCNDKVKSLRLNITCSMTYTLHLTSAFSVKQGWVLSPVELKYLKLQSAWDLQKCLLKKSALKNFEAHLLLFHIN